MTIPRIGTLLGVWAHPDDEAYLSSGLMRAVRRAGGQVVVLTATRGEHGTDDPVRWPPDRRARHREQELRTSLRLAEVHEHRWLGYADGSLAGVPRGDAVDAVAAVLDDVRPDVVVTFGPDGMTGHEDHRTVSAWVTEAWQLTGRVGDLWYATLTPEFHDEWGDLNERVGLWFAGPPPVTEPSALAAQIRLSGVALVTKHLALRAHGSQTRALERLVGAETYRRWWATESFVSARSVATAVP